MKTKKYYQMNYDNATNMPVMDELTYDEFTQMLHLGWSLVYDNVSIYITHTKQFGVDVYQLTTESQGLTDSKSYLSADELLSHGKVCGKTLWEIWDDISLM